MRVRLTRRALRDIGEIDEYSIERWGRRTATKYLEDIHAALVRIGERPTLLREHSELSEDLGFFRVREHLLVCEVMGTDLVVLAVLHGNMDLPRRVAEIELRLPEELRWASARARRTKGRKGRKGR